MRPGGRAYWRRRREYREAVDDTEVGIDYDAVKLMYAIDNMDRPWRDLVNEHGFTAVMQALRETSDLREARHMLFCRHKMRQEQLANTRY